MSRGTSVDINKLLVALEDIRAYVLSTVQEANPEPSVPEALRTMQDANNWEALGYKYASQGLGISDLWQLGPSNSQREHAVDQMVEGFKRWHKENPKH